MQDLEKHINALEGVKTSSVREYVNLDAVQELIDWYQSKYKTMTGHHYHYHPRKEIE